jgi:Helix-turn-helix of DDE superfamily endonuclease
VRIRPTRRYAKPGRPGKATVPDAQGYHLAGALASSLATRDALVAQHSCFMLATNELDEGALSPQALLEGYKGQKHAERGFRFLKDPLFLASSLYLKEFISIYGILGLRRQEAPAMGTLRFADLQTRPTEVLDLTSLTVDEFRQLVPPFEAAFQAHMAHWRLDGRPRTARRYTTDKNCPVPTPEDRWLFILIYLKTYPLQVVQGRLFGMGQSKANQWMHVLLVVLQAMLRALGDAPSRSLQALAQRMGVTEAEAAALVVAPEEPSPPVEPPAGAPTPAARSPLSATMGRSDVSSAPRTRLSRRAVIVARKNATR